MLSQERVKAVHKLIDKADEHVGQKEIKNRVPAQRELEESAQQIVNRQVNPVYKGGRVQKERDVQPAVIHTGQIGAGKLGQSLLHPALFDPHTGPDKENHGRQKQKKSPGQIRGHAQGRAHKLPRCAVYQGEKDPGQKIEEQVFHPHHHIPACDYRKKERETRQHKEDRPLSLQMEDPCRQGIKAPEQDRGVKPAAHPQQKGF